MTKLYIIALVLICSLNSSRAGEYSYDITIASNKLLVGTVAFTTQEALQMVRRDLSRHGFMIPVRVSIAQETRYRQVMTLLEPFTSSSLTDFSYSCNDRPHLQITAWTCPMTFAEAQEITITIYGTNAHSNGQSVPIEKMEQLRPNPTKTNTLVRVFVNASDSTTAGEFYDALSEVSRMATDGYVLWDVKNLMIEQGSGAYVAPRRANAAHR